MGASAATLAWLRCAFAAGLYFQEVSRAQEQEQAMLAGGTTASSFALDLTDSATPPPPPDRAAAAGSFNLRPLVP